MNHPPNVLELMREGTLQLQSLPPLSLYIHLPWCLKKCPYCDFNSHAIAHDRLPLSEQKTYIKSLLNDLESALALIWGRNIHTIFMGGGTPSLFDPSQIDELLGLIRARVQLTPGCEITLEANPATFEKDRFKDFKLAGVNRLSIGVQSFNDRYLQEIGRLHTKAQAVAAAEEALKHFSSVNLDLMYALPTQNMSGFQEDLDLAMSLAPQHLSIYHLTLEPNTYFAKFPPKNLPDEDSAYDMLDWLCEKTNAHGLQRYEVSAFSRPGHQCQHNLNYWQFGDYLGIGAGAHSKLSFAHRIVRQIRVRDPELYVQKALTEQTVAQHTEIARKNLPFEFMLNALRLKNGFDARTYSERTGLPFSSLQSALDLAIEKKFLSHENDWIEPTPLGFDFLNDLTSLFLKD